MRALALLLLLANLCFLGWATLIDVPQTSGRVLPASTNSAPRLSLATERAAQTPAVDIPATNPRSESIDSAQPLRDLTCISLGPYQDASAAEGVSKSLQGAGFTTRQRVEQGEVWMGYWVSVSDLPSPAAAEEALTHLKAGGIVDAYILPGNTTLSLGVFSELPRAQRRVEEVRRLGLEPVLSDRKREGASHWLDIDLKEPGQVIDPALLQSSGTIVRLETRACPAG